MQWLVPGAGAVNITFTIGGPDVANRVAGSPSLQLRGNMANSPSIDMDQVSAGQSINHHCIQQTGKTSCALLLVTSMAIPMAADSSGRPSCTPG